MRKILFILMVLVTSAAFGQGVRLKGNIAGFGGAHFVGVPPGYTKLNVRYEFMAMLVDSGLHVPQYNGTPSGVRTGVWVGDGAIGVDTTNHRFYIYSGGAWVRVANYSEIPASYTAGDGLLLTGSEFKVLTKRSITIDNDSLMLVNDSTASPVSYFYGTNVAGRKGWYAQSGITGVNIYNSDGTLTGDRTVTLGDWDLNFNGGTKFSNFYLSTEGDLNLTSAGDSSTINFIFGQEDKTTYFTLNNSTSAETGFIMNNWFSNDTLPEVAMFASKTTPSFSRNGFLGTNVRLLPNKMVLELDNHYPGTAKLQLINPQTTTDTTWKPLAWNSADSTVKVVTSWPSGSSGMTNPLTTTGDMIYSSSGTTPARRAIGSQGQFLQVSNGLPEWKYDTTTLVTFSAGANFAADTALFTDSTIYGSFKLMGNDTFYVTGVSAVLYSNNGVTDTLGIQITYNDTINVVGSNVFASTYAVNNGTTGQDADGDDFTGSNSVPIPPGNWVWLKSPTVVAGRKPYHLSVSIIGYKKRVN